MKNSVFKNLLILLFCFYNNKMLSQNIHEYKVLSVDSTLNNYIFKLEKSKVKYLVISPKIDSTCVNLGKIEIGKSYKIRLLKSTLKDSFKLGLPLESISIEEKEVWKKDDEFDIYFSDDIFSIYYKPRF